MPIRLVEKKLNTRNGIVTIEADTYDEAVSREARDFAVNEAAAGGLSRPGTSGTAAPYPVNDKGESSQGLLTGAERAAAYRVDFTVTGMI